METAAPPMPVSFLGVPVDATDRMVLNSSAATDTGGLPRGKKRKIHRKSPPTEEMASPSEESKEPTHNSGYDHVARNGILVDTRSMRWTATKASDIRMPNSVLVPGTTESIHEIDVFYQLRQNETGYQPGRQWNESESASTLAASLQTASSPLNHFPMPALRSPRPMDYWPHLDPEVVSPQSVILTTSMQQQLMRGRGPNMLRYPEVGHFNNAQHLNLQDPLLDAVLSNSVHSIGTGVLQSWLHQPPSHMLDETLYGQQLPHPQIPVLMEWLGRGNDRSAPTIPRQLPTTLSRPTDSLHLNDHQIYLREQIEVFEATQDDLKASTQGRRKSIHVGQVGIRCRHCAHIPARDRQTGTMYFPATVHGLYQAAQNMSTNHIQCGLCSEMPESVKTKFVELLPTKNTLSRVGRKYWEETAIPLGLIDTDDGIAFQSYPSV